MNVAATLAMIRKSPTAGMMPPPVLFVSLHFTLFPNTRYFVQGLYSKNFALSQLFLIRTLVIAAIPVLSPSAPLLSI